MVLVAVDDERDERHADDECQDCEGSKHLVGCFVKWRVLAGNRVYRNACDVAAHKPFAPSCGGRRSQTLTRLRRTHVVESKDPNRLERCLPPQQQWRHGEFNQGQAENRHRRLPEARHAWESGNACGAKHNHHDAKYAFVTGHVV